LIAGFYAAISWQFLLSKIKFKWLKVVLIIVFVFFSIPTVIGNLVDFYGTDGKKPALAKVDAAEINALSYLKKNSDTEAVVLSLPFDKYAGAKYGAQPWPIYAWYSTAYIPALAARRTYLSDEEQALITGYNIADRQEKIQKFFGEKDLLWSRQFLKENGISYIYLTKKEKPALAKVDYLAVFYENEEVVIYKVL